MRRCYTVLLLALIFYLGAHEGYLALWKTGINQPVNIYPYKISIYPETDNLLLKKGIPFTEESTLTKLLEDYTS